jgi:NAD-dependent deacetylase
MSSGWEKVWTPKNYPQSETAVHKCDIFLAIGTSGILYPVAGFLEEARMSGAYTVIINREEFSRGRTDLQFVGPASQVLRDIKMRLIRSRAALY